MLLSVDPGIRGVGAAIFRDGHLYRCDYVRSPARAGAGPRECALVAWEVRTWVGTGTEIVTEIVFEWPRIYARGGGRSKGDPNDLRALCGVDGAVAAIFDRAESKFVEPAEWKGQKSHEAVETKVETALDAVEVAIWQAARDRAGKTLEHNVTDAVGIGLKALGRFERKRVFARD